MERAIPIEIGTAFVPDMLRQRRREYVLSQLRKRQLEGLALYHPLPATVKFHACEAKWRVVDGSNRSGKTMCAMVELARALTGIDPKYPKENARYIVVGKSMAHLADPLGVKLFEPGAFKIILDPDTKKWRAVTWDPNDPMQLHPYDKAYSEKWRDAPPLLPQRCIRHIAYNSLARRIPEQLETTNGCRVYFRSGDAKPSRGQSFHGAWIDEQLKEVQWYYEIVRGLMDYASNSFTPRGIWSATPQDCNQQLLDLRRRGEDGEEGVRAFKLLLKDNPYIPDREKIEFANSLSEDEQWVRVQGNYAISYRLAYSTYQPMGIHGCEPFEIPPDWSLYCAVDPGRSHCGTVMAAVDPEEKHVWVFDAFDMQGSNGHNWAAEVKKRSRVQMWEAFICDQQMGRQTNIGLLDEPVAEQYWQALEAADIRVRTAGPLHGFFPGSKDINARELALVNWLRLRDRDPFRGLPKLQVFRGVCPKLDKQLRNAQYDQKRHEKRSRIPEDVLTALEYMAAFSPYYKTPEMMDGKKVDPVWEAFEKKRKSERKRSNHKVPATTI